MVAETGGGGSVADTAERVAKVARSERTAYAQGEARPLGSYAGLLGAYGAWVLGLAALVRRSGVELPERFGLGDLALMGVATHKISRILAKSAVTSPLRAPFSRYTGVSGTAELAEQPRAEGVRHALGELLGCPFCLGQWTATALAFGLVLHPRETRLVASVFTALTAADFLQYAHCLVEQRVSD